jgi:flagellar motor protein MotB
VPFIDSSSRVGRSQGASIFWGLVSVFFAAAACFYFWKSHENESSADKFRDEVLTLQDERDALNAEKDKLQASMSDSAGQLKAREEFLDEKEAKLAAQEARLEAQGLKPSSSGQPAATPQAPALPKKFSDTIHKLSQIDGADTVTRGGRPVVRVPNASFFTPGTATLKPDGQALLNQIATSLNGQSDNFELRIETYTDTDVEAATKADAKYANGWDLTAARAVTIERYYRDQGTLTFQNILVVSRGDSQPITTAAKDVARNRRLEISLAPLPAGFRPDTSHSTADTSTNSLAPPPDASAAPSPKDKTKDKDKEKDKDKAK